MSEEDDDALDEFEVPDTLDTILLLMIAQDRICEMVESYELVLKNTYHPADCIREMSRFFKNKKLALAVAYIGLLMFKADPKMDAETVSTGFQYLVDKSLSYKAATTLNRNVEEAANWLKTVDTVEDTKALFKISKALNFAHQTYYVEAVSNESVEMTEELMQIISSDLY